MALDERYIPLFNLEETYFDKDTGLPLAGGVVKFWVDNQRITPKEVFRLTGTSTNYTYTSMGAQVTLSDIGTFLDSNINVAPYAFPFASDGVTTQLYYVTFENADGVFQFDREAVPYIFPNLSPEGENVQSENQITNPQFVETLFNPDAVQTLSVSINGQVSPIAPGWDIITSGTGTVTVQRVPISATNVTTQPPYVLDINSSGGLSSLLLRQRINNSPRLFAGGNVFGSLVARGFLGGTPLLTLTYVPSNGTSVVIMQDEVTNDGLFSTLKGNVAIPATNTDDGDDGYIDITLAIPVNTHVQFSSFLLVGVNESVAAVVFPQESADRQKDHLFHFYQDSIVIQPKNTMVTGWSFAQNPYQFNVPNITAVIANEYVADQTIAITQQFVTSALGNQISTGVNGLNDFTIAPLTVNNQCAIVQYIDPRTMYQFWGYKVSAMARVLFTSSSNTTLPVKMLLFYRTSLPNTISQTDPVVTWTEFGLPVLASGYTAITPLNNPTYNLTNGANYIDIPFNQFQLPALSSSTQTLGVMFYTMGRMAVTDSLSFRAISLMPNDFAMETNSKTWDQVLKECEFYYEKTFDYTVIPGTAGAFPNGQRLQNLYTITSGITPNFTVAAYGSTFDIYFKTPKRISNSFIQLYSPATGASNKINVLINVNGTQYGGDVSFTGSYTTVGVGDKEATYLGVITPLLSQSPLANTAPNYALASYHATIDARIGR
jgi:hypothetical protein